MTETAFARTFIALCENKPNKLSPTHVEDPRSYPPRSAYILPKLPTSRTLKRLHTPSSNTTTHSLAITLKSTRPPTFTLTLEDQDIKTSILDLKEAVSRDQGVPREGVKLLYKKRPVGDSKVLKDLLADGEDHHMEFGVMIVGGGQVGGGVKQAAGVEEGMSTEGVEGEVRQRGVEVLSGEGFWDDLKGFLVQRLRDQGVGEDVYAVFRKAWEKR